MFYTKQLTTQIELLEAKHLLYQVYIEEQQWKVPLDNPSNLRIIRAGQFAYLQDKFDSVANWFGLFHHDRLIGCIRNLRRLNGKFELENYHSIPDFLKHEPKVVETNRLAIRDGYRGTEAVFLLSALAMEHEINLGMVSSFATAPFPGTGYLYIRKLGFTKVASPPFKYHPKDEGTVHLMHLDLSNTIKMKQLITNLRKVKLVPQRLNSDSTVKSMSHVL